MFFKKAAIPKLCNGRLRKARLHKKNNVYNNIIKTDNEIYGKYRKYKSLAPINENNKNNYNNNMINSKRFTTFHSNRCLSVYCIYH